MADPPPYEESISGGDHSLNDTKGDSKGPQRFSIREEVGASRSQHVAAVVAKLLPRVKERARSGLSKTTLILLPSDQDCARRGELTGFYDDEQPLLIQLEARQDTSEFWMQPEALGLLQGQLLAEISDNVPHTATETPLPPRPQPPPTKSSFFGRKQGKSPATKPAHAPVKAPVTVDVKSDEIFFRTETEFGLYQTLTGRAVILTVEVR